MTNNLNLLRGKATQARMDAATAYRNLGAALAEEGIVGEAIVVYERSLTFEPAHACATMRLHELYRKQEEERYG